MLSQQWLGILVSVLKLLLWPLRQLSVWLFPSKADADGLSAAVTAKAAQQFVAYLRSLEDDDNDANNSNENANAIGSCWSSSSFADLKQQALATQSLLLVYLHAPLHAASRAFCKDVLNSAAMTAFLSVGQQRSRHGPEHSHRAGRATAESAPGHGLSRAGGLAAAARSRRLQ